MRKFAFVMIALFSLPLITGCVANAIKPIKADTIDISFGQSLYEGAGKLDKETIQSLVEAYNHIEYSGQTSEPIDFDRAITIIYIYQDQISGTLVMDENGVFEIGDGAGNYHFNPGQNVYGQALDVFQQLERQH